MTSWLWLGRPISFLVFSSLSAYNCLGGKPKSHYVIYFAKSVSGKQGVEHTSHLWGLDTNDTTRNDDVTIHDVYDRLHTGLGYIRVCVVWRTLQGSCATAKVMLPIGVENELDQALEYDNIEDCWGSLPNTNIKIGGKYSRRCARSSPCFMASH